METIKLWRIFTSAKPENANRLVFRWHTSEEKALSELQDWARGCGLTSYRFEILPIEMHSPEDVADRLNGLLDTTEQLHGKLSKNAKTAKVPRAEVIPIGNKLGSKRPTDGSGILR